MNKNVKKINCDVLVIGSGAAGLRSAIASFERGADVLVVGKSGFGNAHTKLAAGGINASLGVITKKDNWAVHAADTFDEGGKIGSAEMVETLSKNAGEAVIDLANYGVPFERTKSGQISQKIYGAQTFSRTCYVGDFTGRAILGALVKKTKTLGIRQLERLYVTHLFKKNGRITGCFGIDFKKGEFIEIQTKALILAMGGYSRLYSNSSSRGWENMGFGSYLALKNNLHLVDMEMVQFHPSGMTWPENAKGKLVTEAVRSEGARLFNEKNQRFMKKYSPKMLELSARDVVARAIAMEVIAGRGTKNNGAWLDVTHISKEKILKRIPDTFKQFIKLQNLDISKHRMEVSPTAHYSMGGIVIDPVNCSTNLKGLFACGEVTGGLHGGNRLGGNSLAETIVFGKIAGINATNFSKQNKQVKPEASKVNSAKKEVLSLFKKGSVKPSRLRDQLQQIMWENAGVIRDGEKIKEGLEKLRQLKGSLKKMVVKPGLKKNRELIIALDNLSLVFVANAVLKSALMRKESRAAHYRTDFKKISNKWKVNIFCKLKDGKLKLWTKRVSKGSIEFEKAIHKNYHRQFELWE